MSAFALAGMLTWSVLSHSVEAGFDEFGNNDSARNFVGTCTSWHMGKFGSDLAGAEAYCDAYSNDMLKMKWNAEWDRGNDERLLYKFGNTRNASRKFAVEMLKVL